MVIQKQINSNKQNNKIMEQIKTNFSLDKVYYNSLQKYQTNDFAIELFNSGASFEDIIDYFQIIFKSTNTVGYPFINSEEQIVTIKYIAYNDNSIIESNSEISWEHLALLNPDIERLELPLFGEHLIANYPNIAVVTSEKAALIASGLLHKQNILFIAIENITNLHKVFELKSLSNKNIILYPEITERDLWKEIASNFNSNALFSDLNFDSSFIINNPTISLISKEFDTLFTFDEAEERYYQAVISNWSENEFATMLESYNINQPFISAKNSFIFTDGRPFVKVIGNNLKQFCKDYQIINYRYCKEDKFTLAAPVETVCEKILYSNSFFGDMVYNIENHSFNCNIRDNIKRRIENYDKTYLRKEKIKKSDFEAILQRCEEKHLQTIEVDYPSKSLGVYDEILEQGRVFASNFDSLAELAKFYEEFLKDLYNISEDDLNCFILFSIACQNLKLYQKRNLMKTLIVAGPGGIGKDYIILSMLLGRFRLRANHFESGSEKGVTDFSTMTPEIANKILINIISDDKQGFNNSVTLDGVTNDYTKIENKGKDIKKMPKRYSTLITTNDKRCFFDKNVDGSAFARRFLFVELKQKYDITSYADFVEYAKANQNTDYFFAGWFYLINTMLQDTDIISDLEKKAFIYIKNTKDTLIYTNSDDAKICDGFYSYISKEFNRGNVNSNVSIRNNTLALKSIKEYATEAHSGRYSSANIKRALSLEFSSQIKFNVKKKVNDTCANIALVIPNVPAFLEREYLVEPLAADYEPIREDITHYLVNNIK